MANGVQKRRLAVIDVPHHGHDGGAGRQNPRFSGRSVRRAVLFGALPRLLLVEDRLGLLHGGEHLELHAELFREDRQDRVVDGRHSGKHHPRIHQRLHRVGARYAHGLRRRLDRVSGVNLNAPSLLQGLPGPIDVRLGRRRLLLGSRLFRLLRLRLRCGLSVRRCLPGGRRRLLLRLLRLGQEGLHHLSLLVGDGAHMRLDLNPKLFQNRHQFLLTPVQLLRQFVNPYLVVQGRLPLLQAKP